MVKVLVPAKINLFLGVGSPRPDGFHELMTVFHAVNLYEEITACRASDIRVRIPGYEKLASSPNNLAIRAALALRETYGSPSLGADIQINKSIPVAGGMAGGSADAAGVLIACNQLWGLGLSSEQLRKIGAQLGSDIPFSLLAGTALARGRGEKLQPLIHEGSLHWVVAINEVGLATPRVFSKFDELGVFGSLVTPKSLVEALKVGDVEGVADNMFNDLAPAALSLRPDLAAVLAAGKAGGALAGIISGSGPTCAFLVRDASAGKDVSAALAKVPGIRQIVSVEGPAKHAVTF